MGSVIVGVVLIVAAWYTGKRMWAAFHGDTSDCGCGGGCSGCESGSCGLKDSKESDNECGK